MPFSASTDSSLQLSPTDDVQLSQTSQQRRPQLNVKIPAPLESLNQPNSSTCSAGGAPAFQPSTDAGPPSSGQSSVQGSMGPTSRPHKKRARSQGNLTDLSVNGTGYATSPRGPMSFQPSTDGSLGNSINSLYYFSGGPMGPSGTSNMGANTRLLPALLCHRILNGLLVHGRLSLQSVLSLVPDAASTSSKDHVVQILELLCVMGVVQCMRVKNEDGSGAADLVPTSTAKDTTTAQTPATKHTFDCKYSLMGHAKGIGMDVPMLSGALMDAIRAKEANTKAIRRRISALVRLSNDISGHNAAGSYNLREKKRRTGSAGGEGDAAAGAETDASAGDSATLHTRSTIDPLGERPPQHKHRTERMMQLKALVDSFIASNASLQDDHLYRALEQGGLAIGGKHRS